MHDLVRLLSRLRITGGKLRRLWRSVYYGVTNFLIMLGGSVALAAVWYFCFFVWRR